MQEVTGSNPVISTTLPCSGRFAIIPRTDIIDNAKLQALELAEGLQPSPANISRVAARTSPEAARWAFTQWELRKRARAKFARADQMLFTREALEQASHEAIADYHASRFPTGEPVADLTCGIGSDLVALARRGPAIGYEIDPERAAYATHNLAVHGLGADVRLADACHAEIEAQYAFADPSRRIAGRRTLRLDEFSPDPRNIANKVAGLRLAVMKLSPLLQHDELRRLGLRVEFVSYDGECREALVSAGREATPGWMAVHLESGDRLDGDGPSPAGTDLPGRFLYEADAAAIRAGALAPLCTRHTLAPLGDSNGYLTGDSLADSPWLKRFEVLTHGRFDLRQIKKHLQAVGCSSPVLKQRGTSLDLELLRKKLTGTGNEHALLAFYRVGKSVRYAALI